MYHTVYIEAYCTWNQVSGLRCWWSFRARFLSIDGFFPVLCCDVGVSEADATAQATDLNPTWYLSQC